MIFYLDKRFIGLKLGLLTIISVIRPYRVEFCQPGFKCYYEGVMRFFKKDI
jgi:hypothetical protein